MEYFQVVKESLDTLYTDVPMPKDYNIRIALNRLQESYKSEIYKSTNGVSYQSDDFDPFLDEESYSFDIGAKNIDYSTPATRFAYVYKYVASHADMVYQCIDETFALSELMGTEGLKVCSIGCGPGSDLLGILKFCNVIERENCFSVYLYDHEVSWAKELNTILKSAIGTNQEDLGIKLLDITKFPSEKNRFPQADLFTMVYFLSEVYVNRNTTSPFLDHLFGRMESGTMILIIDNGTVEDFRRWLDDLRETYQLDSIDEKDVWNFQIGPDEEKKNLGIYYTKFALAKETPHYPKLTATITCRIWRKV